MILDNEEQRKILLDIVKSINVPGQILDQVYMLKQSIQGAVVIELSQQEIDNLGRKAKKEAEHDR
jgi:hypothetical protein